MSEHQQEEMAAYKRVLKVVVISIVGTILAIVLLAKIAQSFRGAPEMDEATADDQTIARIKPVGDVEIGEAQAPIGSRSGEAVYKTVCASCHDQGLAGAPKTGDNGSWGARIAKGFDTLVDHALNGFNAMPAKGGAPDLTEDEIKRAVAFMANKSGAAFTAPDVKADAAAAAQDTGASVATATAATASGASAGVKGSAAAELTTAANAAAGGADGKAVYESSCVACHGAGVAGAPKFADKAAWSARVGQGKETLYKHAINGFQGKAGFMPAKGGNASLSDAEVKGAVDYMINAVK